MPNEGPNAALVLQFETMFEHLFQQKITRLREYVRVKAGNRGTMAAFGLLGETAMQEITGERHGASQWHDSPSYRRWAPKRDFIDQQILDQEDAQEMLVDLEMGYVQNSVMAANRQIDDIIVDAVTDVTAAGRNGTDTSVFNTAAPTLDGGGGNQIAAGGQGLTLDKMRTARAVFDAREVGLDELNMGMSEFVWVTNPKGHMDLMNQTETTSTDYIGVFIVNGREEQRRMPLVGGRIPMQMGFKIIIVNNLNLSGTDYVNLAWHKNAVGFAMWDGRFIAMDRLPEHRYSWGVTVKDHYGAARVHDKGVLSILCNP